MQKHQVETTVRIVSDGKNVQVFDPETGREIPGVYHVAMEYTSGNDPLYHNGQEVDNPNTHRKLVAKVNVLYPETDTTIGATIRWLPKAQLLNMLNHLVYGKLRQAAKQAVDAKTFDDADEIIDEAFSGKAINDFLAEIEKQFDIKDF